jgi:N-acetylmuramoyl-L-alanine amidase
MTRRKPKSGGRLAAERLGAALAVVVLVTALAWGVVAIRGSRSLAGARRGTTAVATATAVPSVAASRAPAEPPTATSGPATGAVAPSSLATSPAPPGLVVAFQPSHQNDTGAKSWHEYQVCGDIVDRAIAALQGARGVKAWDLRDGLTGTNNYRPKPVNTRPFDKEVAIANAAHADVFVAVHIDGGAPSGILGEYLPGDANGKRLCERLVAELVRRTGLPSRGSHAVRLYSLESVRNAARFKCLVEIGDNVADRKFLDSATGRQKAADAMAAVLGGWR